MTLLLILLLGTLVLVILSGDWRSGLLLTVVIGFAQDPIRKLTPGQPGLYVGFALIAFVGSAFALYQRRGSRLELSTMLVSNPSLIDWYNYLVLLLLLQSANALMRWGLPLRVLIGVGFYISPLIGLWVGFQLGRDQRTLRIFLQLYLALTCIFAITAFLDYRGVSSPFFQAIGKGLVIDFRYGFRTTGAIGLWRSTDMAAMHLTIAACIAVIFAFSESLIRPKLRWITLATTFSTISLLTGRRKAIVQFVVFIGLFFFLLSRYGGKNLRGQFIGALIAAAGIASIPLFIDPSEFLGNDFGEYIDRAASAPGGIVERVNALGIVAFERGLKISEGIGLGVGTLAQTGAANVAAIRGENFGYVSESGIGKVTAELGIPGLIILSGLALGLIRSFARTLPLTRKLPHQTAVLELGLFAFALSNVPFFTSAAGVYGDPFVLIICGVSLGSFFSVPLLVQQNLELQAQHATIKSSSIADPSYSGGR